MNDKDKKCAVCDGLLVKGFMIITNRSFATLRMTGNILFRDSLFLSLDFPY